MKDTTENKTCYVNDFHREWNKRLRCAVVWHKYDISLQNINVTSYDYF